VRYIVYLLLQWKMGWIMGRIERAGIQGDIRTQIESQKR